MEPPDPPYCEAYPAIVAANLPARWRDGFRRGEWYDEKERLVGQFELEKLTIATLELSYQDYCRQGEKWVRASFSMDESPKVIRRARLVIICPGCTGLKPSLHLVDEAWRCRECHGLTTRASLLTKNQKKILKRDRLRREVFTGSPPMRAIPAYERKRIQLMIVQDDLDKFGVDTLPPQFQERISLRWPEPDMVQEELDLDERAEIAPRKGRARKLPVMRADFANFPSEWSVPSGAGPGGEYGALSVPMPRKR